MDRCMDETKAQLIVVYGRLRVGKTYLIEEYYNHDFAFKLTGAYRQPKKFHLESFSNELTRKVKVDQPAPKDWRQAFRLLRNYLESLPTGKKNVVFFR